MIVKVWGTQFSQFPNLVFVNILCIFVFSICDQSRQMVTRHSLRIYIEKALLAYLKTNKTIKANKTKTKLWRVETLTTTF